MADLQDDSINLRALRKIDDHIREILFCAGQVAIYYFNVDDGQWKRKEIEGALFFVRRTVQPEYAFVVINKLSTVNLFQRITKDLETNVQQPYLMYKNSESEIYCVWFYDHENCVTLNDKIVEIIGRMNTNSLFSHSINQFNGLNAGSSNPTQANSDLLKMMLGGGENNNLHEAEIQKTLQPPVQNDLVKPIAQRRSVNLKDLFESQLNISNANAEISTPLKGDEPGGVTVKQEPVTPYQYMREEKIKNNFPVTPKAPQPAPISVVPEANDSKMKLPLESLLQSHNIPANSTLLEPQKSFNNNKNEAGKAMYLSMEQLKKTMIYLLQNDADFLHSIHSTYCEAIKK